MTGREDIGVMSLADTRIDPGRGNGETGAARGRQTHEIARRGHGIGKGEGTEIATTTAAGREVRSDTKGGVGKMKERGEKVEVGEALTADHDG